MHTLILSTLYRMNTKLTLFGLLYFRLSLVFGYPQYVKDLVDVITLNIAVDGHFVKDGADKISLVVLNFVRRNPLVFHLIGLQEIRADQTLRLRELLTKSSGRTWSMVQYSSNAILTDASVIEAPVFIPGIFSSNVGSLLNFDGEVVLVWNIHLTAESYGPYLICNGTSLVHVMAVEYETRVRDMMKIINHAMFYRVLEQNSYPIILLGDFNTPSHLDENSVLNIQENTSCRHRKSIKWPVTANLAKFGFIDAYRSTISPTEDAGNTWSPVMKRHIQFGYEPQDRIDMILIRNPSPLISRNHTPKICTSTLRKPTVETGESFRQRPLLSNGLGVDWGENEWPSDHSAVVLQINLHCWNQ